MPGPPCCLRSGLLLPDRPRQGCWRAGSWRAQAEDNCRRKRRLHPGHGWRAARGGRQPEDCRLRERRLPRAKGHSGHVPKELPCAQADLFLLSAHHPSRSPPPPPCFTSNGPNLWPSAASCLLASPAVEQASLALAVSSYLRRATLSVACVSMDSKGAGQPGHGCAPSTAAALPPTALELRRRSRRHPLLLLIDVRVRRRKN